ASSGFFTDSYNLFATNVILPSLAFVYWKDDRHLDHELKINIITLVGSVLGQLIFGFLADRFGRRKLYGLELIVVIFGTLGLTQASPGYVEFVDGHRIPSMSIMGWFMFWRFFVGLGIGAEYPLSAVITSEFAPVKQRGRMMAAVFLMQPMGQLTAQLVGLFVVLGFKNSYGYGDVNTDQAILTDRVWRKADNGRIGVVAGVGAFPALIAIICRITIPESPRYTLDVEYDTQKAEDDTDKFTEHTARSSVPSPALTSSKLYLQSSGLSHIYPAFSRADIMQYFWIEGNWRRLAGASICWFLLDLAFYGLGINNPRTIAEVWATSPATNGTASELAWAGGHVNVNDPPNISDVLFTNAWQSLVTLSIGSILGSLAIIWAIDYVRRKTLLSSSFFVLAIIFAIIGGTFKKVIETKSHGVTLALYILAQFVFNFGPNTLTFIIPGEVFPTRYRCSCYAIAAASGKLGSIIGQVILSQARFNGRSVSDPNSNALGWVLIIFAVLMLLGAWVAYVWTPVVTYPEEVDAADEQGKKGIWKILRLRRLKNKTLEQLAMEGDLVGKTS
ncbi:MFS general substrate transporter, partial [Saccharata proteae CBS 121410]